MQNIIVILHRHQPLKVQTKYGKQFFRQCNKAI